MKNPTISLIVVQSDWILTFVSSSIAAASDPKALVWISSWHLSVVVSISFYISEFCGVCVVEKEILKVNASSSDS